VGQAGWRVGQPASPGVEEGGACRKFESWEGGGLGCVQSKRSSLMTARAPASTAALRAGKLYMVSACTAAMPHRSTCFPPGCVRRTVCSSHTSSGTHPVASAAVCRPTPPASFRAVLCFLR
jgi:hypothetical protein